MSWGAIDHAHIFELPAAIVSGLPRREIRTIGPKIMRIAEQESLNALTSGEKEQLVFTIEASLQIRRRYQFFIWAQSRLYAMIPHDVLLSAHFDPVRRRMVYDCFSMFPIPKPSLEKLYEPTDGLMHSVVELWNATERMPCTVDQADSGLHGLGNLRDRLEEFGVGEFVAHGTSSPHDGGVETFFCFAQVEALLIPDQIKHEKKPLNARHSFIIELLMPYLHATYQRTIAATAASEGPRSETLRDAQITGREVEILGWVREGKSNQEIGVLLDISPLTVKNHVQKILRKLGATNRAQAVSKAIGLGLVPNGAAQDARA